METTDNRKIEKQMALIYERVKDNQNDKNFDKEIKIIRYFVEIVEFIDMFNSTAHLNAVKTLYLSEHNILHNSLESLAQRLYTSPRKLSYDRIKYARIIRRVLIKFDEKF